MTIYKFTRLTLPPTLEKQRDVLDAYRTLVTEDDEIAWQRRVEIAALRRDLENIRRLFDAATRQLRELRAEMLQEPQARKYNPDQPRVPAGSPHGGEWTSEGGNGPSSSVPEGGDMATAADRRPARGTQYAQEETQTRTDASNSGGPISSLAIPDDSPKRPVPVVDNDRNPILDDRGNQLVGPADLPPETYVREGSASHIAEYISLYQQAVQNELNEPSESNEQAMAGLAAKIALEVGQFRQGGSLDAERVQGQYVRDYHDYANLAIGLYLAAAGVKLEDALAIANDYAGVASEFHEPMDDVYTHLPRRDVRSIEMGYELYQSGRFH
jgi:hypothetical protein